MSEQRDKAVEKRPEWKRSLIVRSGELWAGPSTITSVSSFEL
jgi:hypothetical protein